MTDEIRVKANQLYSEMQNLDDRVKTLIRINSSCQEIQIGNDELGIVLIEAGMYETAIDFIIDLLKQRRKQLEDDYRML